MNTTFSLQLESPLLVNICRSCSACVHTHSHPHVHFVHADPGEALRWRGGGGPRKAGRSSLASNGVCSDTYVPGLSWAVAGGHGCPLCHLPGAQELCRTGQDGCGARPVLMRDSAFHARRAGQRPIQARPSESAWEAVSLPEQEPASVPTQISSGTGVPQRSRQGMAQLLKPGGRLRTSCCFCPACANRHLLTSASSPPSDSPA